ncbi:MAG: cyclophilin-like fold protein [Planctomycetota bacterium]
MPHKIKITAGPVAMTAQMNDCETAKKIWEALPIESSAKTWGREVYFDIPVDMPAQDAKPKVPSGSIAFWPDGSCFCIFFGQTPYSPVNVLGRVDGDEKEFAKVKDGDAVKIEKAED